MSGNTEHADPMGDFLMRLRWRKPAATLAEQTRRRVAVHLIPILFFLYILAYLDRVNISVAQLDMELPEGAGGLGFTREIIGFGGGLFFWGYWILEIPSTLSVVRWGARYVFCRILVLWGICATVVGFIGMPWMNDTFGWLPTLPENITGLQAIAHYVNELPSSPKYQFYFFRFMLGFFEGGFFPSVIVYLSHWFRQEDRAKAIGSFMIAIPLSSAFGLPISAQLLGVNWFGLAGWRWIFIVEGIAPILAGFAVLFFLPNRPSDAKWLKPEERDFLLGELEREHRSKQGHGHWAWVHHLGMVALLTFVYFCLNVSSYGLSMFMPAIIKSQLNAAQSADAKTQAANVKAEAQAAADGKPAAAAQDGNKEQKAGGISSSMAVMIATIPYILATIVMLLNAWHSDRKNERVFHVAVPLAMQSLGIFLAATFDGIPMIPVLLMVVVVGSFTYAHLPAFWPIPTMFLGSAAAASAIGFINMFGNLGGFVGPAIVGKAASGQESFAPSLLLLAPWPLGAAVTIVVVGLVRKYTAKKPS